ncbi:MAG: hypothetical protein RLZZ313_247 [Verrucomicrobiota bacterium]|jgi:hypothetical protein
MNPTQDPTRYFVRACTVSDGVKTDETCRFENH